WRIGRRLFRGLRLCRIKISCWHMLLIRFGQYGSQFIYFLFFEKSTLKQKNGCYPKKNGRIGDVEDGTEKLKVISAFERNPFWPVKIKNRKIQHVNNLAVKPGRGRILRCIVQ